MLDYHDGMYRRVATGSLSPVLKTQLFDKGNRFTSILNDSGILVLLARVDMSVPRRLESSIFLRSGEIRRNLEPFGRRKPVPRSELIHTLSNILRQLIKL